MPIPAVVIVKTFTIIAALGIGAFSAYVLYRNRMRLTNSPHRHNNNDHSEIIQQILKPKTSRNNREKNNRNCAKSSTKSRFRKHSLKSDEEESCSICLEPLSTAEYLTLKCTHCFHLHCIAPWLKRSQSCPNCRAERE